jgi:hypothetical protein
LRVFQVHRITSSYFTTVAEKGAGTAFVDQRKVVNINKATPGIYHNFEALGTKFCCTSILLSSLGFEQWLQARLSIKFISRTK